MALINFRDKKVLEVKFEDYVNVGETLVIFNVDTNVDCYCIRKENDEYNTTNWDVYELNTINKRISHYYNRESINMWFKTRYNEILDIEKTKQLEKQLEELENHQDYTDNFWIRYSKYYRNLQDWD